MNNPTLLENKRRVIFRKVGFFLPLLLLTPQIVHTQEPPAGATEPASLPKLAADLEALQDQFRQWQGNLETKTHSAEIDEKKTEKLLQDLQLQIEALTTKIDTLEGFLNRGLSRISPALAKESQAFQKGLDAIEQAEYQKALTAFQQFLQQFPKSPHISEAQFWKAEARYALQDYANAISLPLQLPRHSGGAGGGAFG